MSNRLWWIKWSVVLLCFTKILCHGNTNDWSSVGVRYSSDSNSKKFGFNCYNGTERSPLNALTNLTLSKAMDAIDLDAVTELKIDACPIETVISVIGTLKNVQIVGFSNSDYSSFIEPIDDPWHNNVVKLNMSHNHIDDQSRMKFFLLMSNLTVLDLSFNFLESIDSDAFAGAFELIEIHLEWNQIRRVSPYSFVHLKKLQFLNLSHNHIFCIADVFNGMSSLRTLHLESNDMDSIRSDVFSLLYHPITVYASWRNKRWLDITSITETLHIIVDGHEFVSSINGKLELHCSGESFSGLQTITANTNQTANIQHIIRILGASLHTFTVLQLSASSNVVEFDFGTLKDMKHVEYLVLSDSNLKRVKSASILQSMNLVAFGAHRNQIENAFQIIPHLRAHLESLGLSANFVGQLNVTTFAHLTNLQSLELSDTNTTIPTDSNPFAPLTNLTYLGISNNNLSEVNFTTMAATLQQLIRFEAANCQIANAVDIFKHVGPSLSQLNLSHNFITTLVDTSFERLINLKWLDLSNNRIFIRHSDQFGQPKQLIDFYIANNDLSHANFNMLSPILANLWCFNANNCQLNGHDVINNLGARIYELDLSNNWMGTVDASTFAKFNHLGRLYLANTSLSVFDAKFDYLFVLDISQNNLSAIEFDILGQPDRLQSFKIAYNHLTLLNISSVMDELEELDVRGNELREMHNFDKHHLPKLKSLAISANQLPCAFLERIQYEWKHLQIDNAWNQKGANCQIKNNSNIGS